MSKVKENIIENYLKQKCKENNILEFKTISLTMNGYPDRTLFYNGKVYLVELKRPGGKPRPIQIYVHKLLKNQNIHVYVLDTKEGIDSLIQEIINNKN